MNNIVKTKKLAEDAIIPEMATAGAAAADIRAYLEDEETGERLSKIVIQPQRTAKIHTKLAFQLPEGTAMLLLPRSSVGIKKNIELMNTIGLLDSDYRGECLLFVKNNGEKPVEILNNERLAQALIIPYIEAMYIECQELNSTDRGTGGFGSTNYNKEGHRII